MNNGFDFPGSYIPLLAVLAVSTLLLTLAHQFLIRRAEGHAHLARHLSMLLLTVAAVIAALLALPISDSSRGDLFGLFGLVITGVFALSSTTFVANAMAGFMLRAVESFKLGDFVQVNEHFGRVTERGLFHTEIQSEDRDLITLPNLYLTTHPVKVVRASGTVISCQLSLGYDVPYYEVEPLLEQAALDAGLEDPFIQLTKLGDHAVSYKAAGFCAEVKQMLTLKTRLHRAILDRLHGAGIEILSPTVMAQRRLDDEKKLVAPPRQPVVEIESRVPERGIFDKAERVEKINALQQELSDLRELVKTGIATGGSEEEHAARRHQAEQRIRELENIIRLASENGDHN
ncbi:MAG TPA: mechanosensitive ion channel protein MscS [Porticoccaceae bacterium]|nr:mechanosensitive ion channel protein MscS [Porticoccaceae bacterium]HCO60765.1 mechanosensitive ion channel protein MscS [Porticoccaceae bacterium]